MIIAKHPNCIIDKHFHTYLYILWTQKCSFPLIGISMINFNSFSPCQIAIISPYINISFNLTLRIHNSNRSINSTLPVHNKTVWKSNQYGKYDNPLNILHKICYIIKQPYNSGNCHRTHPSTCLFLSYLPCLTTQIKANLSYWICMHCKTTSQSESMSTCKPDICTFHFHP